MTTPREQPIYAPSPSSSVNWHIVIPAAAAAAVILVVAAAAGVWLFLRSESIAPVPARQTLQVQGTMNLSLGQFSWAGGQDKTCAGIEGYDDIRAGTEVVVSDAAGKTLVVGALQTGQATVTGDDTASACRLPFLINGVPAGVGPYGVEIGHRGVSHYQQSGLTGIELGFD